MGYKRGQCQPLEDIDGVLHLKGRPTKLGSGLMTYRRNRATAGIEGSGLEPPNDKHGGGGTDSLSLGTNCETTAPLFWTKDSPYFATSKFTAPSFHGCPRTAP